MRGLFRVEGEGLRGPGFQHFVEHAIGALVI